MAVISTGLNREEIDRLIAFPKGLWTADGRAILLTSWKPVWQLDDIVRVTITGFPDFDLPVLEPSDRGLVCIECGCHQNAEWLTKS